MKSKEEIQQAFNVAIEAAQSFQRTLEELRTTLGLTEQKPVCEDGVIACFALKSDPDQLVKVDMADAENITFPLELKKMFGKPYIAHGKESLSVYLFGAALKPKNGDVFDYRRSNRLLYVDEQDPDSADAEMKHLF